MKTGKYLKRVLSSADLKPHISVAINKSTPHQYTNNTILVIMLVDERHMEIPIDAPYGNPY